MGLSNNICCLIISAKILKLILSFIITLFIKVLQFKMKKSFPSLNGSKARVLIKIIYNI